MAYSLLYVSRCLINPDGQSPPAGVRDIVNASQTWNRDKGLTGALVWTPGYFAQILEGSAPVVRLIYARITRDTRHDQVTLLDTRDVPLRHFEDWSLAYAGGSSYVQRRLARLHALPPTAFDEAEIGPLRQLTRELVGAGGVEH